jgi:hypothetical protein
VQWFEIVIIIVALLLGVGAAIFIGSLLSKSRKQQVASVNNTNNIAVAPEKTEEKISPVSPVIKEQARQNVSPGPVSAKNGAKLAAVKVASSSNVTSTVTRNNPPLVATQGNDKQGKIIANKPVQNSGTKPQQPNRKFANNSQIPVTNTNKIEQKPRESVIPANETNVNTSSVPNQSGRISQQPVLPAKDTPESDNSALMKDKTKQMLVDMVGKLTTEKVKQATEKLEKLQETIKQNTNQQSRGLAEIETNLKIAITQWNGKPIQFETSVWDVNGEEFDFLGQGQRNELAQAYVDISLANQIVWVWNELGGASSDLQFSYKSLCFKIADRLTKIIQ